MKKILIMMVTTIIAVMSFTVVASAAASSDVIKVLNDSNIPDVYVSQAESYLNSVTVTQAQSDAIIARIKDVNAIVGDKTKLSELTLAQKQSVLNEFTAAGVVLDLKVVYDNGDINVTDAQSNIVFNVPKAEIIKHTGFDYSIVLYGLALLMLACFAAFATRKVLANR